MNFYADAVITTSQSSNCTSWSLIYITLVVTTFTNMSISPLVILVGTFGCAVDNSAITISGNNRQNHENYANGIEQ